MKRSIRLRFGIWLGRFRWLYPLIGKYSHEHDGTRYYVNRISGTFLKSTPPTAGSTT